MTTPLKDFIGNVKNGMARTNYYDVTFAKPQVVASSLYDNITLNRILLFCDQVQLPGLTMSTTPIRTFGEVREMPYEKLYDNITMSFYVDKEMKVKLFFDEWINGIQNPWTRTFAYYEQYTTDIKVIAYDVANNSRYLVTLYEAYPKVITPVQMDYASKDIMRIQVTMQYKYWKTEMMTNPAGAKSGMLLPGGLSGLLSQGLAIPNQFWNSYVNFQDTFQKATGGLSDWWNSL